MDMERTLDTHPPKCRYCRHEMLPYILRYGAHVFICAACGSISPAGKTKAEAYAKAVAGDRKASENRYKINWKE